MSKYFAKYLAVEGEIKEGDLCKFSTGGILKVLQVHIDNETVTFCQKVKLFLCSRDIQVGDDFESVRTPKEKLKCVQLPDRPNDRIPKDCYYASTEREYFYRWVPFEEAFKVIGEISPEAIWVKEGDMFEEDELEPLLYCLKHPDESIYMDTIENIQDWIKLNPNSSYYKVIINVKGPCGHYH